jgi:hypothetical protein
MNHAALAAALALAVVGAAASAAPLQRDAGERAADARDKIVCKRFVKTGSLVDGYRTCKSKWEWERERENVRQFGVSDACGTRGEPSAGPCNP